jgi:carboxypeptidase Taq
MTSQSGSSAAYQNLKRRFYEITILDTTVATLGWDQETYMPPKAVDFRAEQLSYLTGRVHRLATDRDVDRWLSVCEKDNSRDPNSAEAVNVREWRREYELSAKLPNQFVEDFEKQATLAKNEWAKARAKSDFSKFADPLKKLVDLCRRKADYLGFAESRYDALLDQYEPGMTVSALRPVLDNLAKSMAPLAREAAERSQAIPGNSLSGSYPIEGQRQLNQKIAEAFGFDFESGRVDTTTHPFCTELGPMDQRLTTRYEENNFAVSLYGALHEVGHGLYEQGMLKSHYGTPMSKAVSLGIHESQSRLWENKVGRDPMFWRHWHSIACDYLPDLKRFTPEQITAAVNRSSPSFIRVEADEFFYDLHILLRFQIELRLIEGSLEVAETPDAWNSLFEEYFGRPVPDDANGCLQDIHWSMGGFGYFPTYTLGNLNSAQLYRAALDRNPGMESSLSAGDYSGLLKWLQTEVHEHGMQYSPNRLMEIATGSTTSASAQLDYLRRKIEHLEVGGLS